MATAMRCRAGTVLLAIGGVLLVAWMGYTLTFSGGVIGWGRGPDRPDNEVIEVAVFLPDRDDWNDLIAGVLACHRRGLVRDVTEEPGAILVRTDRFGRSLRFNWHEGGGVVATRDRVARLLDRPDPPVAFIGSNNTVLTVALAEALADGVDRLGPDRPQPVLLVPWATSVEVDRPGSETVELLRIYPDRTFRFCPNNRQEAALVSRLVAEQTSAPVRVIIVQDDNDPYSRDLTAGFEQAMTSVAPSAELIRRKQALSAPGMGGPDDLPRATDLAEASRLWRLVGETEPDGPVWIVLPLQGSPARRLIRALTDRAGPIETRTIDRLHVLCGDGIGRTTLTELSGRCDFPVWCVSAGSISVLDPDESGQPLDSGTQVTAEIVSALVHVLDRPRNASPISLASAMAELELPPDDPASFGRSLDFDSTGERQGGDLGHVLLIRPGESGVLAIGPSGDGDLGRVKERAIPGSSLARR